MYELFKLVRVVSVKNDTKPVTIETFAWRQNGETSLLALGCSNGFILLQYNVGVEEPITKQIAWPPDYPITCMCLDPTVSWLLVQVVNGDIFIIPALTTLDPSKKSMVDRLFRLDDVTIISTLHPKSLPKVTIWWQTLEGRQIAIVATKNGEIIFLDLVTTATVAERSVSEEVRSLELVQDNQLTTVKLLITSEYGNQWMMLLEKRRGKIVPPDMELSKLDYENIDAMSLPIISVLSRQAGPEEEDIFSPKLHDQLPRSVVLSPQYMSGKHLMSAHCSKNSTYEVYDSQLDHSPLFIHKLPLGSLNVLLTTRLLFTLSKLAGDQKLIILSNQKTGSSKDDRQDFNKEAILQQFEFPADEHLLCILPKSYPFYWHEKLEEQQIKHDQEDQTGPGNEKLPSALEIPLSSFTVLDGCMVITSTTVYECKPGISPERLFVKLCINQSNAVFAEQLGISLGLDLNFLFEVVADYLLKYGCSKQAQRLFQVSKASPLRRVSSFARHGYIHEILSYILQVLNKDQSHLGAEDRKKILTLALYGQVNRLKKHPTDTGLKQTLSKFLLEHIHTEEMQKETLTLLAKTGLEDVLVNFAISRGLVLEALETLAGQGHFTLLAQSLDTLVTKGYSSHLAQVHSGAFLQCLDPPTLLKVFSHRPQLVAQYPDLFIEQLDNLDLADLLKLAATLDPSQPQIHGFIRRKMANRKRTSSLTSYTGSVSELDHLKDEKSVDAARLIQCFFQVILRVNKIRRADSTKTQTADFLYTSPENLLHTSMESSPAVRHQLACRPMLVGCGQHHTAVIHNGDLYTWGRTLNGRLGHGEQMGDTAICAPCRVGTLHTLQIRVVSVACGMEHTIALTTQGVYGWGSSKYGQVGLGTVLTYTRPMLLDTLTSVTCVVVDCGQYHSLAITDDARLYTWGWGVHGQLGHGDIEDGLVPRNVAFLRNQSVTKAAAGFCHTLALTVQGEVFSFGCGFFGQLGLGNTSKQNIPVRIQDLQDKVVTIATKFFHSLALTSQGQLYQWGCHPHGLRHYATSQKRARHAGLPGQASFELADSHMRPKLVDTSYVHGKIKKVVCGSFHSVILTVDGEVYTWGIKNMDGQLGTGSRQDVRNPQMVTSINDCHISHLCSGGEFNIAMDRETRVWVWGRNEFGQLGFVEGLNIGTKGPRHSASKNISHHVTEMMVPTLLTVFGSYSLTGSLHESFSISESNLQYGNQLSQDDDEELYELEGLSVLPCLSSVGSGQYDTIVIPLVVQSYSGMCNLSQLLQDCINMKDWVIATFISLYQGNYPQAMSFHYMFLHQTNHFLDVQEYGTESLNVFQYYFGLTLEQTNLLVPEREAQIRMCLQQVFHHWDRENLPVSKLEDHLLGQLPVCATHLATSIFRNQSMEKDKHHPSTGDAPLFKLSDSFISSFSTNFCIKVTQACLNHINIGSESQEPKAFELLKQLGGTSLASIPESMLIGDRLPYDQLWQDIMQNLRKGLGTRKYIYVTHSELDRLDELQIGAASVESTTATFFTCGHYYKKQDFIRELERMSREVKSGENNYPETESVLREYYSRKGCLQVACPRCVLSALASI